MFVIHNTHTFDIHSENLNFIIIQRAPIYGDGKCIGKGHVVCRVPLVIIMIIIVTTTATTTIQR